MMSLRLLAIVGLLSTACGGGTDIRDKSGSASLDAGSTEAAAADVEPVYDASGHLARPRGWQQWVFLGASLNLNYSASAPPASDVLSNVFMEPSAYRHFQEHGEF